MSVEDTEVPPYEGNDGKACWPSQTIRTILTNNNNNKETENE